MPTATCGSTAATRRLPVSLIAFRCRGATKPATPVIAKFFSDAMTIVSRDELDNAVGERAGDRPCGAGRRMDTVRRLRGIAQIDHLAEVHVAEARLASEAAVER